ncbi:IucA/IucC family protein [Undibacterium sp. Di26W]|uniref:IucA/IucC family protein n=1 Tax=Undibacterium sp. Di26W TaxID=3413035 RepID=UPI003BF049AA
MNASLSQLTPNQSPDRLSILHLPHLSHFPPVRRAANSAENSAVSAGTEDYAQRQHAHVLLNCYAREVAMQEHHLAVRAIAHTILPPAALHQYQGQVLDIQLPRMQSRLCVGVRHVSVTGNYDYTTDIYLQDNQQDWAVAGWHEIAHLIISDLSLREGTPYNADLLQQIEESIATMQHLLDAQQNPVGMHHVGTALQHYIRSEQHLLTGHPFHPTPKSRSGWTAAEEKKYSPEHGVQLQLRYVQLPLKWIISDTLDVGNLPKRLQQLTAHGLLADAEHVILPLHPWQADWLLQQPRIRAAVAAGDMRDLGLAGKQFYPTASIRTMLAEDGSAFLKLSLNLRITNCIRNNARHELAAALAASRLYRPIKAEMQALFPDFHALEEQAYISVAFPEDQQQNHRQHKELEDGFGLVLREGLSPQMAQGITPMICASLFGNGQAGRLQVAALIERYAHRHGLPLKQGMHVWFSTYARLAIYPVFYLLFEKGIAFEPHMQNSVIGMADDDTPARFIVRDLELTRLTPKAHALIPPLQLDAHTRQEICCSDEAGWTRIAYCLLVNNICEVIATLANGNHELYLDLWACLRNILQAYLASFPNPEAVRRIQGLLSGEPLPVKGNLLIRFLKQADRKAAYLPLYHPLGVVNGVSPLL